MRGYEPRHMIFFFFFLFCFLLKKVVAGSRRAEQCDAKRKKKKVFEVSIPALHACQQIHRSSAIDYFLVTRKLVKIRT